MTVSAESVTLLAFVGTRPEIIKNLAFCRAAADLQGIRLLTFFTGQNYEARMSNVMWEELGIPIERVNPRPIPTTPGEAARSYLDFTLDIINEYRPQAIISNADTDTSFYTALAGAKAKVPVAHIEGGIRCEERLNPEEINRRLADHLSTWVFTISQEDVESLASEGFPRDHIFAVGDITLDALQIVLREHRISVTTGDYDVLTIHRQENTRDPKRLHAILEGVRLGGCKTVFPIHPRTRDAIQRAGLDDVLKNAKNIECVTPRSYLEMIRLAAGCRKIISDSGGFRREGYMLGKPVISLLWFVWFHQMNRLGFEFMADANRDRLAQAIQTFNPQDPRPPLFGDGRAGAAMLKTIVAKLPST